MSHPRSNGAILHIDSSARYDGSLSRGLSARLVDGLSSATGAAVVRRDLAEGIERVDADWVGATFTAVDATIARSVVARSA